ncbi:hypothetical protein TAL182_CH02999 [Rhizobium sp. TAL182]|uniref:hypothetical protein n=1 Tax=Rhizobium sp. TAL182 TaxID=2020313 RepID=UPI000A21070C|nr:hypothetical protein [Rhizobium sp. TAL182]ARO24745.1 hypothetical protein TAL182_CH02999 [Rhizobium sp. TAL182]
MSNVISLNGLTPSKCGEPQAGLIQVLEELVEMAKAGQLQSFVGTGFASDGGRVSAWGGHHENVYEMLGALTWLQHEYVDRTTTEDD